MNLDGNGDKAKRQNASGDGAGHPFRITNRTALRNARRLNMIETYDALIERFPMLDVVIKVRASDSPISSL